MLGCRVFGHRYRFSADGAVMRWDCERCGNAGGEKDYPSAAEARRYARAFDYDQQRDSTGKRAPLFGLLPLRLGRKLMDKVQQQGEVRK
jgi:hypothetical protein